MTDTTLGVLLNKLSMLGHLWIKVMNQLSFESSRSLISI